MRISADLSTLGKRSEKRAVRNFLSRDMLFLGSRAVARQSFLVALIVLAPVCVLLIQPKLQAALGTITVNTLTDASTSGDHLCSLREAINNANSPGLDTTGGDCVVGTGIDTINFTVTGTITLTGGLPAIRNALTVDGIGQSITVDGAGSFGVFVVNSGATFNLNNMTVAHGSSRDAGGLDNNGTSSVNNASFTGNSGFWGGAIDSEVGVLNITNSTFSANSATGGGGITCGIRTGGGSAAVVNSTFSGNGGSDAGAILFAGCSVRVSDSTFFGNSGEGAAILENGTGVLTVVNSTFSGNSTNACGTVCTIGGSITILNSTFSGNLNGGAVANFNFNRGTSLTVSNSVLSNTTGSTFAGPGNCIGPIGNGGYNISDDGSCNFGTSTGANGQTLGDNVNPKLSSAGLQNNGGPTETIALQADSPAIDAIPITHQCPTTDQRGEARPDSGELACDVGAYEAQGGDAPINATGTKFGATEGVSFTGTVATFTDQDPGSTATEYSATIDWGDTTSTSAGTISGPTGGPFSVTGTHTYAEQGTYSVTVTITDVDNTKNNATAISTATVGDGKLSSTCATMPVSTQIYSGPTAIFTDQSSTGTLSDFSASIDWGDGSSSAGTIAGGPGNAPYTVSGTHTYASTGTFLISTSITDVGGSSTTTPACSVIIFAFATSKGAAFVIGDLEAGLGNHVTWWSSQWATINLMSGGISPDAMKGFVGFEDNFLGLPPPNCGGTWSTDTGNSTPPPPSVPQVMGVIVSSKVTQAGSIISGDIRQVVIVRNDPGYAPDPGHPGTGTEIGIACTTP